MAAAVGVLLGVASPAAQANETPAPETSEMWIVPTSAEPGERVKVWSSGWAPRTQLQAVVCGQEGVGGSPSCHLPGAVTAMTNDAGEARHTLVLAAPPKPCPCVVRITTFTAPALALNVPVTVEGHPTAVVPSPEGSPADLRIADVQVRSGGWLRPFLGLGGSATLVMTVVNTGDETVPVPEVATGVARRGSEEVELTATTDPGREITHDGTDRVEVEVDLPWFAFGAQDVAVQWADGTGEVERSQVAVYPVGLLLLMLGAVLAVVRYDVREGRLRDLRAKAVAGAMRFLDEDGRYPLPEVVYVEEIGGYLVKPAALKGSRLARRLSGRVSVCDLAALVEGGDRVKASYADGRPLPPSRPRGGAGLAYLLLRDRETWRN